MNYFTSLLILVLSIALSNGLFAQKRDLEKEAIILQELDSIAPALVETFKKGTVAMDNGSYSEADSLYTIVYEKVPNFDHAIRRLGIVKSFNGSRNDGLILIEKAVTLNPSYANLISLASCLVTPIDSLQSATAVDLHRALVILVKLKKLPDADEFECNALIAQTSIQLDKMTLFREATTLLKQHHQDKMLTHYYAALLAAYDENWRTAEYEIKIAYKMGLPAADMHAFLDSGVSDRLANFTSEEDQWSYVKKLLWVVLFWASGFLLLYIIGMFLSFYTIRSIEKQVATNDLQSSNSLRKLYKLLINSAGFYYYISLPIVLILVIAMGGTILVTMISLGFVQIHIVIVVVIMVGATVFGMLRSLFVKSDLTEPGRLLLENEAPGLFSLTKEVARTMGTRPIDEIRITPDTDLAVYEIGSWREKMNDTGKRILLVGAAVIKDFEKNDFRAILAHEYGHFTNRDTAGGGVALRVRKDMYNYYFALVRSGQAGWWNVGFWFIRFYNFLFIRISAGATRLQEVLADRASAQTYGVTSFKNGLTFVIRRNIEFMILANAEIEDAEKTNRAYKNLYELSGVEGTTIEDELKKELNKKTTVEDTHPSPNDRFKYIQGITEHTTTSDTGTVSGLFTNWNEITNEMTNEIREIVALNKQFS